MPNIKIDAPKITDVDKNKIIDTKPCVGITYLDKNRYGLKHLFKAVKDDSKTMNVLEEFLETVRGYNSRDELIANHCPKTKFKNCDKESEPKIKAIRSRYNVDATDTVHLHCKRNGKGEFVLHGFWLKHIFEVVRFDCKHDVHKV